MDFPFVSVLVPIFRVERYIERCARSVLEQTYPNVEYIFVDDGSDDASIEILEWILPDYPNRSNNVHIIHHDTNRGLAAARNTAVEASRGEFLFHVDADDWVESNAIELLLKRQQDTDADIVSAEAFDHTGSNVKKHLTSGWNLGKKELLIGILTYKVSTSLWRRLIRRSLYSDYNIRCDEQGSGGEDFQVLPRLVYYAKRVTGIQEAVYHYNLTNSHSIMNNVWSCVDTQIQGLVSVRTVVQFFSDKESFLQQIVAGKEIRYIHSHMVNNVIHRNKEGYKTFLRHMRNTDKNDWPLVQWNYPLIRCLENNFYSMMLCILCRRATNKIKSLLKRI